MALQDLLDRLTLTRRFVRSTERIATALEVNNQILLRLADQFAPVPPQITEEDIRSAGPVLRNESQLARLEEWTAEFQGRVGRPPTDADVEEWLLEDAER